ncbi:MAG TPA: STAS domain-containing protein [Kiritimatiellia bacterium]|nr:STAS domain-containing protein [Kiritimatiellia bacterium]
MELSVEKRNDVAIVAAGGRLDAGGAPEFETRCKALLQEGAKRLLLDLAQVDYVSSAGLRSLLVLAKAVKSAGGAMALCSLAPAVRDVMTISGFDNILPLAADRAAALDLLK